MKKPWRSDPPEGDKMAAIAVIIAMLFLAAVVLGIGRVLSGGPR